MTPSRPIGLPAADGRLRPAQYPCPVSSLPASAATAVALFAATNVDDLVVLALLSAASRAAACRGAGRSGPGSTSASPSSSACPSPPGAACPGPGPLALAARPDPAQHRRGHAGRRHSRAPRRPPSPARGQSTGRPPASQRSGPVGPLHAGLRHHRSRADRGHARGLRGGSPSARSRRLLTRHRRITDTLARYGRLIFPAAGILIALYTLHTTNDPSIPEPRAIPRRWPCGPPARIERACGPQG